MGRVDKVASSVEWWTAGLSPGQAVHSFHISALISVIIQVLMEERLSDGTISEQEIIEMLGGGRSG